VIEPIIAAFLFSFRIIAESGIALPAGY